MLHIEQRFANVLFKGPHSKYFSHCELFDLYFNHRQHIKDRVWLPIKLYLYKQVKGWIWPTDSNLPTPDIEISLNIFATVVLSFVMWYWSTATLLFDNTFYFTTNPFSNNELRKQQSAWFINDKWITEFPFLKKWTCLIMDM